ncbi:MAG: DUF1080 domain-containing protein [Planctomycetota bacterium]
MKWSWLLLVLLAACANTETDSDRTVAGSGQEEEAEASAAEPVSAGEPVAESEEPAESETPSSASPLDGSRSDEWRVLFGGDSLDGWEVTSFGGEGEVRVREGGVRFGVGSPLTGIHYTGEELPVTDYEISLTATRVQGSDFFCGLTFPVEESHCTLVLGGWGGALCGLSCIDGKDAADNDTMKIFGFENGRAYRVRLRVTGDRIRAWLDDELLVDQDVTGKELSLRPEVSASVPLGVSAFVTIAEFRDIRIRRL